MSLLEYNLTLTVEERCRQRDRAATQLELLRSAALAQIDGLADALAETDGHLLATVAPTAAT